MTTVTHSVELNAPVERVWAFVTALRYLPAWLDGWSAVREISTPATAAGTTMVVNRGRRHDHEDWIVAEWHPPGHLRLTEYRPDIQLVMELTPSGAGTHLTLHYTWPARGLDRLFTATGQRQALQHSLAKLRQMVVLNQDIKLLHGMGDE